MPANLTVNFKPTLGLVSDIPASELGPDAYSNAKNMHFRSAFAERTTGHASVYETIQAELRGLLNYDNDGTNFWIYAGQDTVYGVQTSTHTDLTPGGGLTTITGFNTWTMCLLNGIPIVNNGTDPPMSWDGDTGNNFAALTNWVSGDIAYSMRAYKYHLLAIGLTASGGDFPSVVKWSTAAAAGAIPGDWVPSASNDAGQLSMSATPGKLIDGAALGSAFILYKPHAAHELNWVGGNDVFEARTISKHTGMLTRNCVQTYRGRHVLVTDGDIVITDGHSFESIIDLKNRDYLFQNIDNDAFQNTFMVTYPRHNEIWVCYPSSGNTLCDSAMVWDGGSNSWGPRDLPSISCGALGVVNDTDPNPAWSSGTPLWSAVTGTWGTYAQGGAAQAESLVLGQPDDDTATDSLLFEVDSGTDFNGTPIVASVGKYSMHFDEPDRFKLAKRVIPRILGTSGDVVNVRVGTQNGASESIAWSSQQPYTIGTTNHINILAQGRYLSVEFSSTGGSPWKVAGFAIEYSQGGYQ